MAYCVDADVTAAGATGAPPFTSQIAEGKERIDRFCGDTFEPTTMTVEAVFGSAGIAPLPRRVQSVTSVTLVGGSSPIDTSAWRLRSASINPGSIDAIELLYGYDDLVVGAERWNGGWFNLGRPGSRILVAGSFGYAAVPATIKTCNAKLSAWLANNPGYGAGDPAGVKSLSVEGYNVTFDTDRILTTGLPEVDRLLLGLGFKRIQVA